MCAELADRQDSGAGNTLRLSAVPTAGKLKTIGRYRILSELGQGAMARVYLALDPNIDRRIALKVLEPRVGQTTLDWQELRTRFLLEARAAGNLRHPAAVAIYDADHDADSGFSYIAMEWVDGQSLAELLRQETVLSTDQAIDITTQMAGALDAAHRQGLIHRDVKPANILLGRRGEAKLSDFGIAKAESLELTSTGQVLGTPFYMSPEQIRDEELDGRSDLFSLGVVLYECLTGKQPFRAESLPALTHKILNVEPVEAGSLNPEIPSRLATTIKRALAKNPEQRFQTGAELIDALEGRVPVVTSTVGLTEPQLHARPGGAAAEHEFRRARWRKWLGALVLLVAVASMLTALWRFGSKRESGSQEAIPSAASQPVTLPSATEGAPSIPDRATDSTAKPETTDHPVGRATLQLSYTNRLKSAEMTVWVDGEPVLTKKLYGPRGFFKRAVGRTMIETIPVPPGHHDVKVTVRGSAGKIEASNRTGNTFDAGQTKRLRIELIPPSYLKLAWK